jgi:hypothetical protein
MANVPLRNLGEIGVITDANPYTLPSNAFSRGQNVVFDENRVQRAPLFKQMFPAIRSTLSYNASTGTFDAQAGTYAAAEGGTTSSARFVSSYSDPQFGETVLVCDADGVVRTYPNGNMTFSYSGVSVTNDETWSHAQVAGLSFLARKGMRPYARNIRTDGSYSLMGGDWVTTHSANVVRGYLDFVLCLNVTKGATEYPTMVKWSNPVEFSSAVADLRWDPANPGYVAGENIIGEMTTPIKDGCVLGSTFVIYSATQVWLMEYTGSSLVFNFRKLFETGGVINTNCVVEVEGKHYVFGEDDIYVHDGMSKQSIADGRVRAYIYNAINRSKKNSCFVMHDGASDLIYFCYNTLADEVKWKGVQFCNQAAVFNYRTNTWSFMDMPNLVGGGESSIDLSNNTYQALTGSYEVYNSSYVSFEGIKPKVTIALGITAASSGLTESRVYAVDLPSAGVVNLPVTMETLVPAVVERVGIDLDDSGSGISLRAYKNITCITPQAAFDAGSGVFVWEIGSSDLPNGPVVYRTSSVFNPNADYKIDTRVSGRYLAYKITSESLENFKISGFDSEITSLSKR